MDLVVGEHWMISTCIEYSKENEPQIPRALVARGYIVEKWFSIPKKPAAGGYIREKKTGNTQSTSKWWVYCHKIDSHTHTTNNRRAAVLGTTALSHSIFSNQKITSDT